MATSPNGGPALAERADIHKSCKSLETLLNILNDYCEAASAVSSLQKKLAKSVRETAALKVTGEVAANALNTSANIFEALSDIDHKFAKIADKEYDGISSEVKKWFKKLAKEEKAHDEKLATADTKIKQAGQALEKKAKKKSIDVSEEHARYISLISSLGPEISQAKYNHSLAVTQRQNATTYSVAACLARVADAEWLRTCEGVRRFSPSIGQLGEWRSLCEGGWSGPVPPDLPSVDTKHQVSQPPGHTNLNVAGDKRSPVDIKNLEASIPGGYTSAEFLNRSGQSSVETIQWDNPRSSPTSPDSQRHNQSFTSSTSSNDDRNLLAPPTSFDSRPLVDPNTGSVRSLSAFPSPPTHVPSPSSRQQQQVLFSSLNMTEANNPTNNRIMESPTSIHSEVSNQRRGESNSTEPPSPILNRSRNPSQGISSPQQQYQQPGSSSESNLKSLSETDDRRPRALRSHTFSTETYHFRDNEKAFVSGEEMSLSDGKDNRAHFDGREFGMAGNVGNVTKARTTEGVVSRHLERTDTETSKGSIVTAMQERLSNSRTGTTTPPKEILRLLTSVPDLATRFESPGDGSLRTLRSPTVRKLSLPPPESPNQLQKIEPLRLVQDRSPGIYRQGLPTVPNQNDDARHRRQQIDHLIQLEVQEKERDLNERALEMDERARELEKERLKLMNMLEISRNDAQRDQFRNHLRPRLPSLREQLQRPLSQMELDSLQPGSTSSNSNNSRASRQTHSPSCQKTPTSSPFHAQYEGEQSLPYREEHTSKIGHASYCGCETCSISKYKLAASPMVAQETQKSGIRPPLQKAKGGWMRRLSMPVVGSAFNLDSKRSASGSMGVGTGIAGGKGILDGKKNSSTTALTSKPAHDNGSILGHGLGIRSMTNLGVSARR